MRKRGEIHGRRAKGRNSAAWEADPQGKRPNWLTLFNRVNPRIAPFFRYYDAHLALRATRWIVTRALNSKNDPRPSSRANAKRSASSVCRVFTLMRNALYELGMNPIKLGAVRRQAQDL